MHHISDMIEKMLKILETDMDDRAPLKCPVQ